MKKTNDKREFKCPFPCSCAWRQAGNPKCPRKDATVQCSAFMSREELAEHKRQGNSAELRASVKK